MQFAKCFMRIFSVIEFLVMLPVIIVAWLIMVMIVVLSLAAIVGMFRGK